MCSNKKKKLLLFLYIKKHIYVLIFFYSYIKYVIKKEAYKLVYKQIRKSLNVHKFNLQICIKNKWLISYIYMLSKKKQHTYVKNINILNNKNYLIHVYNNINFSIISKLYYYNNNVYFFWHFFNEDALIKIFVNLTMKQGKKDISYKNIYNCLFFLKKVIGVQPITIIKKFLVKNRFLFDITYLMLKKKTITIPKLLSVRSQVTKSVKYILNSYSLKKWKIKKKHIPFFKKISYLILNSVFNRSNLRKVIRHDTVKVKKNFSKVRKEEFFSKYVKKMTDIRKKNMYRIKRKSITKKMKFLSERKRMLRQLKQNIDISNYFILNRYNINIQCKKKIKSKWC